MHKEELCVGGDEMDLKWITSILGGSPTHFVTYTLPSQWTDDEIKRDQTLSFCLKLMNRKTQRKCPRVGLLGYWEVGPTKGLQHLHGIANLQELQVGILSRCWAESLARLDKRATVAKQFNLWEPLMCYYEFHYPVWNQELESSEKAIRYSRKNGREPFIFSQT